MHLGADLLGSRAHDRDYQGDLAYRLQLAEDAPSLGKAEDNRGRVATPEQVEFVGDEEGEAGGKPWRWACANDHIFMIGSTLPVKAIMRALA